MLHLNTTKSNIQIIDLIMQIPNTTIKIHIKIHIENIHNLKENIVVIKIMQRGTSNIGKNKRKSFKIMMNIKATKAQ